MFSKQNIRGIIYVVVIVVIIALAINFAKPRKGAFLAEPKGEIAAERRDSLFVFDPNSVSYEELLLLGFDKRTAVGIIKYRTAGKVFGIAEELALCYGVSDSMFARVRPYIKIGSKYATKPKSHSADSVRGERPSRFAPRPFEKFSIDTVGVDYLRLIGF